MGSEPTPDDWAFAREYNRHTPADGPNGADCECSACTETAETGYRSERRDMGAMLRQAAKRWPHDRVIVAHGGPFGGDYWAAYVEDVAGDVHPEHEASEPEDALAGLLERWFSPHE